MMYRMPAEKSIHTQRRALSLAVCALAGITASASHAQQTAPASPATEHVSAAPSLPKVTVTGSHIPRLDVETATPTLVIRREEIRRTGVETVKELIDSLTNSTRSLSDISGSASFAAGASSASLRHLGPQSTLVLLNSRRLPPFALNDDPGMFVNLDTLPLDAIERVEVLRSGASAIYGSDAVAGVINIITRRNYRGMQMRASREKSPGAHEFDSRTVSLTAGFGDPVEDRYNVLMNVEFYQRSSVMWSEVLDQVNPQTTRYSSSFGTGSSYSHPGNVIGGGAVPGCPAGQLRNGVCYYDRYARMQAQPAAQRANLLLSGELHIDATLKGFAEVLYATTETRYVLSDPAYGATSLTWFDPSTGQPRFYGERGLPIQHPLNPTGVDNAEFRYRFTDADSRLTVQSDSYRLLAGLRGHHEGLQWEAAVGTMGGHVDSRGRGYYSDSGFKQTIGDYTAANDPSFFNRSYRIGQANSAAVLNTLFPEFASRGRTSQTFLDAKASARVGSWRGRAIDVAAGFDLRHETLRITPTDNLARGDIVGYGVDETSGSRTFGSLSGELNVPLSDSLEMQAAARLDRYPDFRPHVSPKLGLRFEATPSLMLRGTVEGGFRAPNLAENSSSTRYSFDTGIADPRRCPQAQAFANALYQQAAALPNGDPAKTQALVRADGLVAQECGRNVATVHSSNPDLRPEKSVAGTLGLVWQPAAGYLANVDYWVIRRRNEIGYKTAQELINADSGGSGSAVTRLAPGGDTSFSAAERAQYGVTAEPLAWTNAQIENTASTLTSGIDVAVQSRTRTPLGIVTGGFQATYLLNFQRYSPLREGYGDNLAGRYGYPRLRGALSVSLASGQATNAFRLNVLSGTRLQGDFDDNFYSASGCLANGWSAADCRVRHFNTLDYFFSYRFARGLTLGANVRNLLNQRPPVDLRAFNELGGGIVPQDLRDVQRRVLRVMLEYKFF